MEPDVFIERKILIGLITSTEYLRKIRRVYSVDYMESPVAKIISGWCIEFFDKYNKAPERNIENIYYDKLKKGKIEKNLAEEFEQDILPSLSQEYERGNIDINPLLDLTKTFFEERHLTIYNDAIKDLLHRQELQKASQLASEFKKLSFQEETKTDEEVIKRIFDPDRRSVLVYPGALGELLNHNLVRGKFIAFMAKKKQGKSFLLLDLGMRGLQQGSKVAFFQAGDMTEEEQIERICTYLSGKPILESSSGKQYSPMVDCIYHQLGDCNKEQRQANGGNMWNGIFLKEFRDRLTFENLKNTYKSFPEHKTCRNCSNMRGTVWLEEEEIEQLQEYEALDVYKKFREKYRKTFRLSTHSNKTLSIKGIRERLREWEWETGFRPDILIVDYADILIPDGKFKEFRHGQKDIWQDLRALSQDFDGLLATVTQSNAQAFDKNKQTLSHQSEDKTKADHVSCMYAYDQNDREKDLGISRMSIMAQRNGRFSTSREVYMIQDLNRARAFIGSFHK